jgi:hypothetical protein
MQSLAETMRHLADGTLEVVHVQYPEVPEANVYLWFDMVCY